MKTCSKKNIAIVVIVAILLCGISFYSGIKYAGIQRVSERTQFAGQFGMEQNGARMGLNGQRTGMRGGGSGMVSGEILSKDAKSITIKDRTGGSKIVFLGASTEVMKSSVGALDDLTVGTNVITNGTPNADGSITALTVQIRPDGQGFGFPEGAPTEVPKATGQ
ncbi:MAG: hypothetical protein WC878_04310 [Candidatus Paceibacterota bacterium]